MPDPLASLLSVPASQPSTDPAPLAKPSVLEACPDSAAQCHFITTLHTCWKNGDPGRQKGVLASYLAWIGHRTLEPL